MPGILSISTSGRRSQQHAWSTLNFVGMRSPAVAALLCAGATAVIAMLFRQAEDSWLDGLTARQGFNDKHPQHSMAPGEQLQLSVLTLNTWGLWLVARRRQERMAALADYLRR